MAEDDEGLPERIEPEDARLAVARNEVRVIDVRPADAFAAERIFGSVHADPDRLDDALADIRQEEALLFVCADGSASADVAERMRGDGRRATSLEGGFDAWTSEGLPTAPGRDEEYEGPDVKIPGAVSSDGAPDDEGEDDDEERSAGDEA